MLLCFFCKPKIPPQHPQWLHWGTPGYLGAQYGNHGHEACQLRITYPVLCVQALSECPLPPQEIRSIILPFTDEDAQQSQGTCPTSVGTAGTPTWRSLEARALAPHLSTPSTVQDLGSSLDWTTHQLWVFFASLSASLVLEFTPALCIPWAATLQMEGF